MPALSGMRSPKNRKLSLSNRRLFKAINDGNVDRIERLLGTADPNVDPTAKDEFGRPMCFVAVMKFPDFARGDPILDLILNHPKMNINIQTTKGGYTLLHYAAEKSLAWAVRRLLQDREKINVTLCTKKGQMAEQLATDPEIKGLFQDFSFGRTIEPEDPNKHPAPAAEEEAQPPKRVPRQMSAPGRPLEVSQEEDLVQPGAMPRRKSTGSQIRPPEPQKKRSIFSIFGKSKKSEAQPGNPEEGEPLLAENRLEEAEEGDLSYDVEKLKVELEVAEAKCAKAKETEATLRNELAQARREVEDLQNAGSGEARQSQAELRKELAQARREIEELKDAEKSSESAVRKELKAAKREIEDLKEAETELPMVDERLRVIEELKRVTEGEPALRKELIEAKREVKALKRASEGENGLRDELEKAKRRIEELQSQQGGGGEGEAPPFSPELTKARREILELKAAPIRLAGIRLPRAMPATDEGRNKLFDALTRLQVTLWDSARRS